MKHATVQTLERITGLLDEVRQLAGIKERKFGVFYRKSRAFLHFHEDAGKVYADVRLEGPDFDRFAATTAAQQQRLLAAIRTFLQ